MGTHWLLYLPPEKHGLSWILMVLGRSRVHQRQYPWWLAGEKFIFKSHEQLHHKKIIKEGIGWPETRGKGMQWVGWSMNGAPSIWCQGVRSQSGLDPIIPKLKRFSHISGLMTWCLSRILFPPYALLGDHISIHDHHLNTDDSWIYIPSPHLLLPCQWVQIRAMPFTPYVTLGKSLKSLLVTSPQKWGC